MYTTFSSPIPILIDIWALFSSQPSQTVHDCCVNSLCNKSVEFFIWMHRSYSTVGSCGSSDFGFRRQLHTQQMTALATALTNSAEGFVLSSSSTSLQRLLLFIDSSHCDFCHALPWCLRFLHIFSN